MAELQFPDVVGSYLAAYNNARQQKMAEQDRARTYQRQDRQDEMAETQFAGQQDAQKLDMALKRGQAMASIIGGVRDGDVQGFETAKQRAAQELGLTPEQMAHLTINDLPRLRSESGLALKQLQEQAMRANIRQSDAAAEAARANADYIRGGKGGGAGGGKFGPGGKPLTERESKDLSWALRGDAANKEFTPERITHLIDSRNVIGRNVPLVGNKLQTDLSRQAVQTAKNFVAVVLRKDTGAAVTEKEFDFYEDIFIPAWGDDDGTLQMKSQARTQFLQALKMGLGPRAALAQLGVQPPEGLAPPEDDKTSVIEAQGGGWSATVEE